MKVLHVFTLLTTPESFFYGQFGYLAEHGHEIHLVTDDEEDIEFSRRNHIIYNRIPIIRAISPMGDIGTIKKLMQLIRGEK